MYIEAMIESEIATNNRHMFLYGRNTPHREKLLKTIADKYPFVLGSDTSSVIFCVADIPAEFVKRIIQFFSYFSKNKHSNIAELVESIKSGKEFWSSFYYSYLTTGDDKEFDKKTSCLDIVFAPFLDRFAQVVLEASNNNAFFQLVLDRKKEISIYSVQSINSLIGSRINGEMNIKVACECDEWESAWDGCGNVAEYVHDYTILELDNSLQTSFKEEES